MGGSFDLVDSIHIFSPFNKIGLELQARHVISSDLHGRLRR